MQDFSKIVKPGAMLAGYPGQYYGIFAKIEFKAGKLSISGVIGPKSNGNCHGSAGQFIMSFKEYDKRGHATLADIKPAPGWTADTIKQFFDIWDEWHLNDMRAGCEHQRAAKWGEEEIEVITYKLTLAAFEERNELIAQVAAATARGELLPLTPYGRALLGLKDWYADKFAPPDADSPLSGCYEVSKRETKRANWVRESEHPRGVLCKPCPICGYKYGSQWRREEVPAAVLEFLKSLPDTDTRPAWV